jgi:hypothetical protein
LKDDVKYELIDSAFAAGGFDEKIKNEQSVFDRNDVDENPFYQSFGVILGYRK